MSTTHTQAIRTGVSGLLVLCVPSTWQYLARFPSSSPFLVGRVPLLKETKRKKVGTLFLPLYWRTYWIFLPATRRVPA